MMNIKKSENTKYHKDRIIVDHSYTVGGNVKW